MKKRRPKEKFNLFYVGHPKISAAISRGFNDPWTKATEEEAVEHAKKLLNEDSIHRPTSRECYVVVKIVRIIRRKRSPIEVVKL